MCPGPSKEQQLTVTVDDTGMVESFTLPNKTSQHAKINLFLNVRIEKWHHIYVIPNLRYSGLEYKRKF